MFSSCWFDSEAPSHSFALIERMVARQIAKGTEISLLRVPRVETTSSGHFSSKEGSGMVLNVMILEKPSSLRKEFHFDLENDSFIRQCMISLF